MGLQKVFRRRALEQLEVRHIRIPCNNRYRFVLATDIHARDDWFPAESVREIVEAVEAVPDVDAVLYGGDYVGDDLTAIDWAAPILGSIDTPKFATLGNHDHWTNPKHITTALEDAGVNVITNKSVELVPELWLAGIDSCWDGKPDPKKALEKVPAGAQCVVLGHEPYLGTMHDEFLHLAGHTHHGQVCSPVAGEWVAERNYPRYSQPWPKGYYDRGRGRHVWTSAGVGFSTVSFRLNCPPDITVVDLEPGLEYAVISEEFGRQ